MKNVRISENNFVKMMRSMMEKSIVEIAIINGDNVNNISVYNDIDNVSVSPIIIKKIMGTFKKSAFNVDRHGNMFIKVNEMMYIFNLFTSPYIEKSFIYYCEHCIKNEYSNTHLYNVNEDEYRKKLEEQFAFLD